MLQRSLASFFLLAVCFLGSSAGALVFLAPEADLTEYQNYLLRSHQRSYTQRASEKISQRGVEAQIQVLDFSQRALKEGATKQVLLDWERLRLQLELNPTDREVLTLLAEKMGLEQELCRYILLDPDLLGLLENPEGAKVCFQKGVSLPRSIQSQFENQGAAGKDLLVVDGMPLNSGALPAKMINGPYRWKVLSNRYKDQTFQGSAYDFSKVSLLKEPWVSGHCQSYKLDHPDFSVSVQSKIFFDSQCAVPGLPPEKTFRDWAHDHKAWLWGLGILATGLAAFQLKDKVLVITKP